MPTAWAPCPGNKNAVLLNVPNPWKGARGLTFFHLHNGTPHVVAALRANYMRRDSRTALWTEGQLTSLLGVVRPTLTGPRIGMFSLWDSHDSYPATS